MTRRRLVVTVAQIVIVALALWFAGSKIAGQWTELRRTIGTLRPAALPLLGSVAAVLTLYTAQIHGWRVLVAAWGTPLPFWQAARIWTISNLARFLPASPVFTTGTMAVLGTRAGVSPVAAAGSAVLGTVLSLGTGFVVLALTGASLLRHLDVSLPAGAGPVLTVLGGAGLVALPAAVGPSARLMSRILGRRVDLPTLPIGALLTAVTTNLLAWFLYGVALRWLALAFFPGSGSDVKAYVAVFTAGYLAGFLAIPVPAGLGVREGALLAALPAARLLTPAQAAVVVVASRLVLTILEALPGALFLARDAAFRSSTDR